MNKCEIRNKKNNDWSYNLSDNTQGCTDLKNILRASVSNNLRKTQHIKGSTRGVGVVGITSERQLAYTSTSLR